MGREIKFRIWDELRGLSEIDFYTFEEIGIRSTEEAHQIGIVIEQYTGLKDKNGVEIYEGDILESEYRNYKIKISIGKAKYIGCGVELYGIISEFLNTDKEPELFMYNSGRNDWEIIGNIHQ